MIGNMKEIWRSVIGYEGFYEVSNLGHLRSVDRVQTNTKGICRRLRGRIIRPGFSYGYPVAVLTKNGKKKSVKLHRLVAEAFIPNPYNKPCIDHIDTNRNNCFVCNLRWVSHKENANNPISMTNYSKASSKAFGSGWKIINTRNENKSIHAEIPVSQFSLNGEPIHRYRSIADAARQTGIQRGTILGAVSGSFKQAGGYLWAKDGVTPNKYVKNPSAKRKKVYQYSAEGSFVNEWASVSEAERALSITNIARCARLNRFLAGGFKWSYEKRESLINDAIHSL